MKTINIIIEVIFEEGTYCFPQDIIENINLEYLNQAFNLHGIEKLVVSGEEALKQKISASSIYQAIANFQSELEEIL